MNPEYWKSFAIHPENELPESPVLELKPGGPPTKKPAWFKPPSRLSLNMEKVYTLLVSNLGKRLSIEQISTMLSMPQKSVTAACKALSLRGFASPARERAVVEKRLVTITYMQGVDPAGKLGRKEW
jgi:hypothetical protein